MYIKHGLELSTQVCFSNIPFSSLLVKISDIFLTEILSSLCFYFPCTCNSDLEEAQLPLEEYASLRDFFVRKLKEGSRPIDADPYCLVTSNKYILLSGYNFSNCLITL